MKKNEHLSNFFSRCQRFSPEKSVKLSTTLDPHEIFCRESPPYFFRTYETCCSSKVFFGASFSVVWGFVPPTSLPKPLHIRHSNTHLCQNGAMTFQIQTVLHFNVMFVVFVVHLQLLELWEAVSTGLIGGCWTVQEQTCWKRWRGLRMPAVRCLFLTVWGHTFLGNQIVCAFFGNVHWRLLVVCEDWF